MRKQVLKQCLTCPNVFLARQKKVYCGHQKTKTGCAYKRYLAQHVEYNKVMAIKHPEKIRQWNRIASTRYRKTDPGRLNHRYHSNKYNQRIRHAL